MNVFLRVLCCVVSILLAALTVAVADMEVVVYSELKPGARKWMYEFSTTQRCYTFSSCFDGVTIGADWSGIGANTIVFYSQDQCKGQQSVNKNARKDQVVFDYGSASIGARSFMVWESAMYATRGFTEDCRERAVFNGTNSSESSYSDDISFP